MSVTTPVITAIGTPTLTRATSGSVTGTWGTGQNRTHGNLLVAVVTAGGSTASAAAIATSSNWNEIFFAGNAGQTSAGQTSSNAWVSVWAMTSNGGEAAPSFTATLSGTVAMTCTLLELQGASTGSIFYTHTDAWGTAGSGASAGTVSLTPQTNTVITTATDYAIGVFVQEAAAATATWTPGASWTNIANDGATSSVLHTAVDYQNPPASGSKLSENGTFSPNTTAFGIGAVVAFLPAMGGQVGYSNDASTTISSGGTTAPAAGTTEYWTAASWASFPSASPRTIAPVTFYVADPAASSELVRVLDTSSGLVMRGAAGTTPVSHGGGFTIQNVIPAGNQQGRVYNIRDLGAIGDGFTDDTAAIQAAIDSALAAGVGVVYIPGGDYKFTNLVCTSSSALGVPVYFVGDGPELTRLRCYATSGDAIRYYSSAGPGSGNEGPGGGGLFNLHLEMSNASANVNGLHAGDVNWFRCWNVYASGCSGTGIPLYFDSSVAWTEGLQIMVYCYANANGNVVLDVSGATAATSFRALRAYIDVASSTSDALRIQGGAYVYSGEIVLRGSMVAGASSAGSALNLTGQAGAGVIVDGPTGYSQINNSRVDIAMECDNTSTVQPTTITCNSHGNNIILGCWGQMHFTGGGAWTPSPGTNPNGNLWPFWGPISGDANLVNATGAPLAQPFSTPGGLILGSFSSPVTLSNNSTITTANGTAPVVHVTNSGNVTGIIMQNGAFDGNVIIVINTGTGSVTFAASGSHVADGSSDVIASGAARMFVWDGSVNSLWYRMS